VSRGLTAAEAAAGSIVAALASAVGGAYLVDRIGIRIAPIPVVVFSFACGVAAWRWWRPPAPWPRPALADLLLSAATAGAVFGALVWLAWPELLPLGGGSDLTHHLQLVDFIDRNWRLPHSPEDAALVGNMINYTPGFHLLASLGGALARRDGLHAVHVLLAVSVAIKVALLALIVRRTLAGPGDAAGASGVDASAAGAVAAAVLVFLPDDYVVGSFVRFSFLSQVVAELFAVAMWLAVVAWRDRPSAAAATIFGLAGAGAFLTWPVWIGPPLLVLAWALLAAGDVPLRVRARHGACAVGPIAVVAALHVIGRADSVAIVQSGGAAFRPELARFTWPFVALAVSGTVVAAWDRRASVTAWLIAAVALQGFGLFVVARLGHADSPYLALKMPHFAIYPLAAAGALSIAWLLRGARRVLPVSWRGSAAFAAVVWLGVLGSGVAVAKRFAETRRPAPAITEDLFQAGQWARTHVQADCIEYLVPQDSTSYWLHLAVLGNPSQPSSGTLPSIFVYRDALVRWISGTSDYPVAIADMTVVPREVRDGADVLAQFGQIIVARRPRSPVGPNFSSADPNISSADPSVSSAACHHP
jgi:hypothetical protein